jgi:hypothetical protein
MRKVFGAILILVGVLVLLPSPAAACRSCDVPEFWVPGCASTGCSYCAACNICCGGDPNAGGNCAEYCGGAAPKSSGLSLPEIFLKPGDVPGQVPGFLINLSSTTCSSAPR